MFRSLRIGLDLLPINLAFRLAAILSGRGHMGFINPKSCLEFSLCKADKQNARHYERMGPLSPRGKWSRPLIIHVTDGADK
jgi:hypothetical protein